MLEFIKKRNIISSFPKQEQLRKILIDIIDKLLKPPSPTSSETLLEELQKNASKPPSPTSSEKLLEELQKSSSKPPSPTSSEKLKVLSIPVNQESSSQKYSSNPIVLKKQPNTIEGGKKRRSKKRI
jgi:hypothetical protein